MGGDGRGGGGGGGKGGELATGLHKGSPASVGAVNNGLVLSQGLLTFWQPPANSILLHRSGRTMQPGPALNEALPPTVFPFRRRVGNHLFGHCPNSDSYPRKRAGKGREG